MKTEAIKETQKRLFQEGRLMPMTEDKLKEFQKRKRVIDPNRRLEAYNSPSSIMTFLGFLKNLFRILFPKTWKFRGKVKTQRGTQIYLSSDGRLIESNECVDKPFFLKHKTTRRSF